MQAAACRRWRRQLHFDGCHLLDEGAFSLRAPTDLLYLHLQLAPHHSRHFCGTYCLPPGQTSALYVSLYCLLQPALLYLGGRKCIGNRQVAEDASGPGASPCPSLPVPGSVYLPPHKPGQLFQAVLDNSAVGCPYHLQEAQFCNGPFGSFHGLSILANCFRYLKLLLFLLFTASPPPSFAATCLASTVYCLCQSANQHL